jgi:autotransporter-associated beta strand protein
MGLTGVGLEFSESAFGWNGGVGGAWIDGGGGWSDNLDGAAATWSNAKPVIAHFTNSAVGTSVTVGAGGVATSDVDVSGGHYNFAGGSIMMINTSWSVSAVSSASVASSLSGTGGLTKSGEGVLVLAGSNNSSGPTVVESGRLMVDGDHSSNLDEVVVRPGAALGGGGRLGGLLELEAGARWIFAPQSTLTVEGAILGGFDLSEVEGLGADTLVGRYRLLEGSVDDAEEFSPSGETAAVHLGNNRRAWLEIGPGYVELVVAGESTFAGWLLQYELSGADAAMTAAPAGDGIPNLFKYAFNLDPTRHEGSGLYPGEYRGLPHFTAAAGSHLEMIYYRDTAKPDIDLTPVWRARLEDAPDWAEVPDRELLGTQGSVEKWRARITLDDERGFLNIRVNTR